MPDGSIQQLHCLCYYDQQIHYYDRGRADMHSSTDPACVCAGVNTHADTRDHNPGNKYAHWELKGMCVRLELGPRDMAARAFKCVRRDNGASEVIAWDDIVERLPQVLVEMQAGMLAKASERVQAAMATVCLVCSMWR